MRAAWIMAFILPLSAFAGCSGSSETRSLPCAKDTDCKGARICSKGTCVFPGGDEAGAGAAGGPAGSSGGSSAGGGGRSGSGTGGARAGGGGPNATDSGAGPGGTTSTTPPGDAGGPECTKTDVSACAATGLGACCTRAGTCGVTLPLLGCVAANTTPGDSGTGTLGGGIVSAQCSSCRASSCPDELTACEASAKCKTVSACIDKATAFGVLNCVTNVDQATVTTYDALSACAKTHCTSCPSINL